MATNDSTTDTNDDSAPDQLQIDQAIVMLNEICQRVFHAREVSGHLRSNEDHDQLITLAVSLRDSLDVVGLLADSDAQKIGGASGNDFHDPMEWVMPPFTRRWEASGRVPTDRVVKRDMEQLHNLDAKGESRDTFTRLVRRFS